MTPSPLALAAVLVALAVPAAAAAHGVSAEVDRRGAEVAVRARYANGRPLADARFVVTSPAHPERPHAEGRTDRHGWLVFVPDATGTWKVRIADATGHGKVVSVEVERVEPGQAAPAAPAPATAPEAPPPAPSAERPAEAAPAEGGALRAIAGAAGIAGAFVVLWLFRRRRRPAGR